MVLVEQSKVVTRSCRAVSAELIRRVKCCRKDMQRFIVPMEKSSLVERRPARQRHGIKCQPHKKCQIANNEVAYLYCVSGFIYLDLFKFRDGPFLRYSCTKDWTSLTLRADYSRCVLRISMFEGWGVFYVRAAFVCIHRIHPSKVIACAVWR